MGIDAAIGVGIGIRIGIGIGNPDYSGGKGVPPSSAARGRLNSIAEGLL